MPNVRRITRSRDEEEDVEDEETAPRSRSSSRGSGRGGASSRNGRAAGSRSRVDEDEEDEFEDEDEEEERPRSKGKGRVGDDGEVEISGGWKAFHRNRDNAPSDFFRTWKPGEEEELVKFLDETCFASIFQHWIDEMPKGKPKSYTCRNQKQEKGGGDCPLCEMGDTAKLHNYFNVVPFADPDNLEVRVYDASMTMTESLERFGEAPKTRPLNNPDVYYEAQMVGGRHQFHAIKAAGIEEDWAHILPDGPLDDDELDDLEEQCFDKDFIKVPSRKDLREIVRLLNKSRE